MPKKVARSVSIDRVGLIVAGIGVILGLVASFVLSTDAVTLAKNSHAVLNCSVSLTLNCATVAKSAQAEVFGFPNSFIGIAAMSVLATIIVVYLTRVVLPRWFLRATAAGLVLGLIFAGWMFYQSFFVIQVLCPWCLATDLGMILITYGLFRYLARLDLDVFWSSKVTQFSRKNYDLMIAIGLAVLVVAAILTKFGADLLG